MAEWEINLPSTPSKDFKVLRDGVDISEGIKSLYIRYNRFGAEIEIEYGNQAIVGSITSVAS